MEDLSHAPWEQGQKLTATQGYRHVTPPHASGTESLKAATQIIPEHYHSIAPPSMAALHGDPLTADPRKTFQMAPDDDLFTDVAH